MSKMEGALRQPVPKGMQDAAVAWFRKFVEVAPHCVSINQFAIGHAYRAGYQAVQSESGWVPIADIPEEWKRDDFLVDLFVQTEGVKYRLKDCIYINGHWEDETGLEHNGVSHAMLPPPPPKKEG